MEIWDLYNLNGEIIGEHTRGTMMPENGYHLVVHVWIRNSEGKYLMTKRSANKKTFPLTWECVGGSVLQGEDSFTAALREVREEVGEEDYKRAKFVLGEKDRVLAVCDALNEGDYEKVGELMYQTHEGLSKDYEVSCEELDYLNELAKENEVTGSRIMGGGFGGCTINLVRNDLYKKFIENAKQKFAAKYGHEPKVYDVVIGDGSRRIC